MEVREDDEEFQNPVDMMFEDLRNGNPIILQSANMPNIN